MDITEFVENGVIPQTALDGKTTAECSLILALCLEEMGEDVGMVTAYFECIYFKGDIDIQEWVDSATECFEGEYANYTELAENVVEVYEILAEMPEHLRYYFDYEKYGRELQHDYWEKDGYYFRNN